MIKTIRSAHLIHRKTEREMTARRTTEIDTAAGSFHDPEKQ